LKKTKRFNTAKTPKIKNSKVSFCGDNFNKAKIQAMKAIKFK